MLITLGVSFGAVAGLLWAEVSDRQRWLWLFKPLAAACFIVLALQAGTLESDYGRYLLVGLLLCWCGDVFLIPASDKSFLFGLGSFLLGHLLYAISFLQLKSVSLDQEWKNILDWVGDSILSLRIQFFL